MKEQRKHRDHFCLLNRDCVPVHIYTHVRVIIYFVNNELIIIPQYVHDVHRKIATGEYHNDGHQHFGSLPASTQLTHRTRVCSGTTKIYKCGIISIHFYTYIINKNLHPQDIAVLRDSRCPGIVSDFHKTRIICM